jgi:hypothetical protein
MKLFEHPDFEQAILRATEHFHNRGLRATIIEKDYYVTEVLRLIATKAPDKIIFKGGTSLAKGWNLKAFRPVPRPIGTLFLHLPLVPPASEANCV